MLQLLIRSLHSLAITQEVRRARQMREIVRYMPELFRRGVEIGYVELSLYAATVGAHVQRHTDNITDPVIDIASISVHFERKQRVVGKVVREESDELACRSVDLEIRINQRFHPVVRVVVAVVMIDGGVAISVHAEVEGTDPELKKRGVIAAAA